MKTDDQIQQDVLRELASDTRVERTKVGVEVDSGVVTLSGILSDYLEKMAAQDAAFRAGVLDIVNNIAVYPSGAFERTDAEVAQAVRQALRSDARVPDQQIRTTTAAGRVTLEGDVTRGDEREAAQRAVRHLLGVRAVVNQIEVAPSRIQANSIHEEIECALVRLAEERARQIRVDVRDGMVQVAGLVDSWHEHEAVLTAARRRAVSCRVEDLLTLASAGAR
jgi:osmotically-inducible protein OsmY